MIYEYLMILPILMRITNGENMYNFLTLNFLLENRLYWADGHQDKIESIDIYGLNRKEVLKVTNQQLVDIDLFGSYLYYTAWNTQ